MISPKNDDLRTMVALPDLVAPCKKSREDRRYLNVGKMERSLPVDESWTWLIDWRQVYELIQKMASGGGRDRQSNRIIVGNGKRASGPWSVARLRASSLP